MNNNIAVFMRSFAYNDVSIPYYSINGKKYICEKSVDSIYYRIYDMLLEINDQIKKEQYSNFIDLLESVKSIVEEDRDYLIFDEENAKYVINKNLQSKKVYLYEGLEEYMHKYYNIALSKELKNYENNVEEFLKDTHTEKNNGDHDSPFTIELMNASRLFRLRFKNKQI